VRPSLVGLRLRRSLPVYQPCFDRELALSEQADAARHNYELVNDSYVLGVASILALLDAQSQLLNAELAVANALSDFLEDLIAAEQQMAYFPFLEPEAEVAELLDRIEQQLQP